jgi:hypothetical protein
MERNGNEESDGEIVPQLAGETQAVAFVGFVPFSPTEVPSRQRSFLDDIEMAEVNVVADSEAVLLSVSSGAVDLVLAEGQAGGLVPVAPVAPQVGNIPTPVVPPTLAVEEGEISLSDVVALAEGEVAESEAEAMGAEATEEDYLDALTAAHQRLNLYDRARRCLLEAIVTGDLGGADHVASRLSDKVKLERAILRNTRIVHNIGSVLAFRLSVVMLPLDF